MSDDEGELTGGLFGQSNSDDEEDVYDPNARGQGNRKGPKISVQKNRW